MHIEQLQEPVPGCRNIAYMQQWKTILYDSDVQRPLSNCALYVSLMLDTEGGWWVVLLLLK